MTGLQLDYANCLSDRVGKHGLDPSAIEATAPLIAQFTQRLEESKGTGWECWRSLPFDPVRTEHIAAVSRLVDDLRDSTEHLIVLGVGGSALGNIALHAALNPHTYNLLLRDQRNGPRLYVLDNVDPQFVSSSLDFVRRDDPNFARTVVNVISKSGETAETAAQFMILRSMLKTALGD